VRTCCADMLFYATSCVVSAASIGIKAWLLADKLRSRHQASIRVGAVPHFALEDVRRATLRATISLLPGASILQEKFESSKMKKVKYVLYVAQASLAEASIRCSAPPLAVPKGAVRRRLASKTSRWER
jgi:hypothetical protein